MAGQHSITNELKLALEKLYSEKICENYQDILALCANQAADWIEAERYVTPAEKFCLRLKTIKTERFARIFKRHPIVPLYGDMQTTS